MPVFIRYDQLKFMAEHGYAEVRLTGYPAPRTRA